MLRSEVHTMSDGLIDPQHAFELNNSYLNSLLILTKEEISETKWDCKKYETVASKAYNLMLDQAELLIKQYEARGSHYLNPYWSLLFESTCFSMIVAGIGQNRLWKFDEAKDLITHGISMIPGSNMNMEGLIDVSSKWIANCTMMNGVLFRIDPAHLIRQARETNSDIKIQFTTFVDFFTSNRLLESKSKSNKTTDYGYQSNTNTNLNITGQPNESDPNPIKEDRDLIFIPDENGVEHSFEVLFTFDVEKTGKSYMVLTDASISSQDQEDIEVHAFRYTENGNDKSDLQLFPIETDEEWEFVEEMIKTFEKDDL